MKSRANLSLLDCTLRLLLSPTSRTCLGSAQFCLSSTSFPKFSFVLESCAFFAEKEQIATWLFRVGNLVFILARILSVIFSVLTFWFGLEPFASQALRYLGLGLVGGLQCYLLFQFAIFQAKRLKGSGAAGASPKRSKASKEVSDLPEVDQNTRKQALTRKLKSK